MLGRFLVTSFLLGLVVMACTEDSSSSGTGGAGGTGGTSGKGGAAGGGAIPGSGGAAGRAGSGGGTSTGGTMAGTGGSGGEAPCRSMKPDFDCRDCDGNRTDLTCFNTLWSCPTVQCGLPGNGGEGGAAGAGGQSEGGAGNAPAGCERETILSGPDGCEVALECATGSTYSLECQPNGAGSDQSVCRCSVDGTHKQTIFVEATGPGVCARAEPVCVP